MKLLQKEGKTGKNVPMLLLLAVGIEAVGALLLSIRFIPVYGMKRGAWLSVFHAVSAFCNAGFDLFGGFSSLTAYARDPLKVEVQIPQRFEQMPPQLNGMVYDIPCLQSTGGTIVYYPMSVVFCDGL